MNYGKAQIYLSNGKKVVAEVVRLNAKTVWVRLDDGNVIKRKLHQIASEDQARLQRFVDEQRKRLGG